MSLTKKMKLIVDTNAINSDNIDGDIFGNMQQLCELSDAFDIVIPKIVLDEIIKHKNKRWNEDKNELLRLSKKYPTIIKEMGIECTSIKDYNPKIDIDRELNKLPFNVEVIDICDSDNCLKKMRELALENVAPFENKSDKGFKDTIIALTIDEYVKKDGLDHLVFVCSDSRLVEYFEDNEAVECFSNFAELKERLDELRSTVPEERNISTDIVGRVTVKESPQRASIRSYLSELRNARNFKQVHEALSKISKVISNFTVDDFVDTMISATDNDQIHLICYDSDVKKYYGEAFDRYGWLLPDDKYNEFVIKMGLNKTLIRQPKRLEGSTELESEETAPF